MAAACLVRVNRTCNEGLMSADWGDMHQLARHSSCHLLLEYAPGQACLADPCCRFLLQPGSRRPFTIAFQLPLQHTVPEYTLQMRCTSVRR